MSLFKAKMDKCLYKANRKSHKIDSKIFRIENEIEYIDGNTYSIDTTYWWWGPYHSGEQAIKNQRRKKGQED